MHVAGYRKEDIDAAKADVDRATADETRAHLDFQRYDALAQKDLVSKQQRDTAEANWKIALAAKENAQHKLDELQRGFRPEEVCDGAKRDISRRRRRWKKMQHGNRREDVQATSAELAYEEARFRERQVLAPTAGQRSRCSMFVRVTSSRRTRPSRLCSRAIRFTSASMFQKRN